MKYFLLLTSLFYFGCAQDNSNTPPPTIHGLGFGTHESICDGQKNVAEFYGINFGKEPNNVYTRQDRISDGCTLVSYGTYTYDGVTLTTTEIRSSYSPIYCTPNTPRPPVNLTGTTTLREFRLVWGYTNQAGQNCTVYFNR